MFQNPYFLIVESGNLWKPLYLLVFWHWLQCCNADSLCFPVVFAMRKPSKTIVFHVLWRNMQKTIIFVAFENIPEMEHLS